MSVFWNLFGTDNQGGMKNDEAARVDTGVPRRVGRHKRSSGKLTFNRAQIDGCDWSTVIPKLISHRRTADVVNEMHLRGDLRISRAATAGESNRFCTWSQREIEQYEVSIDTGPMCVVRESTVEMIN